MKKPRNQMKHLVSILTVVVVLISFTPTLANNSFQTDYINPAEMDIRDFVDGEFIIKFTPNTFITIQKTSNQLCLTGVSSIDILNEKYKVLSIEPMFDSQQKINENNPYLYNIYKFILPLNSSIQSIIQEYVLDPHVLYAEPNYRIQICVIPNDPKFNLQWALHNTGQTGGTIDADIDAPEAWDIETGDENIVIAIHDTGVDWDHPDLEDNIWVNPGEDLNHNGVVDPSDFNDIDDDENGFIDDIRGWDFVDTNDTVFPGEDGTVRDNDPMDFHGHGTHCSGIASAVSNNNIGIAGVCWNCNIMPIRALYMTSNGSGHGEEDDLAAGIVYAADNGADVLSMSWGSDFEIHLIEDGINYAYSKGVIMIAAAGNSENNIKIYPAAYDNVIAVAATDHNDEKAYFTNYGSWVDIAAPGVDIYSTLFNDTYISWSGTSMSTPTVAGLVGLILSKHPDFTQDEVRTILRSTTDEVISNQYIGVGRINAYKAIQRDNSPVVNINSDLDDAIIFQETNINGTACGNNFLNYSIYYGIGVYPDTWSVVYESYTPVINDVLAILNTSSFLVNQIYTIRLVVYDTIGQISEDRVIVLTDTPPEKPKIDGPTIGKKGSICDYYFTTIDYNQEDIYYYIDWGDKTNSGWIGPYVSGKEITISHKWSNIGKFIIYCKAKDVYGAESDWSDPLTVTVSKSKNKVINTPFLSYLYYVIQNHPNLFLVFQKIIIRCGLQ